METVLVSVLPSCSCISAAISPPWQRVPPPAGAPPPPVGAPVPVPPPFPPPPPGAFDAEPFDGRLTSGGDDPVPEPVPEPEAPVPPSLEQAASEAVRTSADAARTSSDPRSAIGFINVPPNQ
ncbi:hypothetical protein GCM10022254_60310 [Actinomadura meridiana]|uniref:Uncharacterized protein n=1 Tax=Actinomadura meridiana TaxID=559626 RepID=A0ABP8CIC0_9ACTN